MKRYAAAMTLLLTMLAAPADAATFRKENAPEGQKYQYLYVEDVIGPGDEMQLERLLSETVAAGNTPVLVLSARGGDVDISMMMGRSIRRHGGITYNGNCAYSCVFAYLGGVQRFSMHNGKVGLYVHRPKLAEYYLKDPSQGMYKVLMGLKDYIVEMTESDELYTLMMQIPFHEPRYLTEAEAVSTKSVTQFY